ncbi:AsnC family transcriptional regulator [Azospirillum sp. A1-3]|uniref:siroheme decarboxylase subunit beta n=1 Tax=Azospirillum sp. A1-3 TaxID=185874 RepID=UPI002076F091|nr:AsnC family transcriptional regulator [Azospirillum sp. A1-3]MCM8735601.1 AsnC family transcriptional regulator [Azospirillum sp. A1-3]
MTESTSDMTILDAVDRRLVVETQAGLPLVPRPYAALAARLGIAEEEVIARFGRMLRTGIVRRIAAVPNHYRLGYAANGMSVWEVPDAVIDEAGRLLAAQPFVTHCYRRPAHPPDWPYTLFAMVHARDRAEVEARIGAMADLLEGRSRSHAVLYSTRILKKTGLRLSA